LTEFLAAIIDKLVPIFSRLELNLIPFVYKLRKEIRFEKSGNAYYVISEIPLNIVKVNERAVRILKLCNGKRSVKEIAETIGVSEEYIFKICDYFNKKGVLQVKQAHAAENPPFVSVIIPVKDRKKELAECLRSVFSQDYPGNKLEVIVIDDGSSDGTEKAAKKFPVKLIANHESRGQSYCRNLGAKKAKGSILAFLDSDCVAGKKWLRELTIYFQCKDIGVVGGYVDGYYNTTGIDRYEKVMSPLNMGKHPQFTIKNNTTFYVPTCNLLVRKKVYSETGGIREDMHIGEDVDLCWRLRKKNYGILYAPYGAVKHKHRNSFWQMLKRRGDYGSSEPVLYSLHKDKKKILPAPVPAALAFLGICAGIAALSVIPLLVSCGCYIVESMIKAFKLLRLRCGIKLHKIFFSTMRTYFSLFYYLSFHIVRYYLIAMLLTGFFYFPVWLLSLFMMLLCSLVDYAVKKPNLNYPFFLMIYILEHIAYQIGVFTGCLRARTFGSYRVSFARKINPGIS